MCPLHPLWSPSPCASTPSVSCLRSTRPSTATWLWRMQRATRWAGGTRAPATRLRLLMSARAAALSCSYHCSPPCAALLSPTTQPLRPAHATQVAQTVGVYYAANAVGRLVGTLASGALYSYVGSTIVDGFGTCLMVSVGFAAASCAVDLWLHEDPAAAGETAGRAAQAGIWWPCWLGSLPAFRGLAFRGLTVCLPKACQSDACARALLQADGGWGCWVPACRGASGGQPQSSHRQMKHRRRLPTMLSQQRQCLVSDAGFLLAMPGWLPK